MIDNILNQRAVTHGKFSSNATTSQQLKHIVSRGDNYPDLSMVQREALDMILHKISRIVNGNCEEKDHWLDICGYSQLVLDDLQSEKVSF